MVGAREAVQRAGSKRSFLPPALGQKESSRRLKIISQFRIKTNTFPSSQIHDSSLGGSSDEEDFLGVLRGPSSFANAFLYVGLGTVAIGLVISFVGTGEKGFKTTELRLIGPSLIGEFYTL